MGRIINAVFWTGVWLAFAINSGAAARGNIAELFGVAIVPALFWWAFDGRIRTRRKRKLLSQEKVRR